MTKLKPCPVCGGAATLMSRKARKGYEAAVRCNEGCVLCMTTTTYDTEDEAIKTIIKRWNTRTPKKKEDERK